MIYTQPPEEGYHLLCHLLDRAEVVPFLGAGASMPENIGTEQGAFGRFPTARELAQYLANKANFPGDEIDINNLLEVATYFSIFYMRTLLEAELANVFNHEQEPGSLHRFLASVSAPLLVVTTNYDTLLERAFLQQGREFHLIMTPSLGDSSDERHTLWWAPGAKTPSVHETRKLALLPQDIPVIYKLHGGFDATGEWHSSVITEDDYFEIGGRIYERSLLPAPVHHALQQNTMLFLGYSLRDVHVRQLMHQLRRYSARRKSFLVTKRLTTLDRARFDRDDLEIYEMTIADFVQGLTSRYRPTGGDGA